MEKALDRQQKDADQSEKQEAKQHKKLKVDQRQ